MNKENETLNKLQNGNDFIADVSISTDLKVGDKIDLGNFITELKEIKFDKYADMDLYWFYNERGEYKYNLRDFITKV